MAIHFIPNDPLAGTSAPPIRSKAPRPDRPTSKAGFVFENSVAEGEFAPGTPEFLFWQCREAALAALDAWESFAGDLAAWSSVAADQSKLLLRQNAGNVPNALYDRKSFSFFQSVTPAKTTYSGTSTDVVSHEIGHGLLDSVRTDLFDSTFLEAAAFHEGFADCMALLTALSDQASRQAILAVAPDLASSNFLETMPEDLSDGMLRARGATVNSAGPRHALNTFQFQIPSTLSSNGPPGQLINESHSFGQVFSGSFYDCVRNVFTSMPSRGEQDLLRAAQSVAKILLLAVRSAPLVPRFFESVGRAMLVADEQLDSGANQSAIQTAFGQHSILVAGTSILAPKAELPGDVPALGKGALNILDSVTHKDLLQRIGASPRAKLAVAITDILGQKLVRALHKREVSLAGIDKRLAGVIALAEEPIFVGSAGKSPILMGSLPEEFTTQNEVRSFVSALLEHDRISFESPNRQAVDLSDAGYTRTTHAIRVTKGKKILARIRFLCH